MTIESWKYEEFVKANNGKFSVLDFIHAVSAQVTLPSDFARCMGSLFAPQLTKFDNVIVIVEWFDEARYEEYRSNGMSAKTAQAWVNMVELTDILRGISFDKAKELAEFIVGLWNERIGQHFPSDTAEAKVLLEEDREEVFVTIGEFSSHQEAVV